MAVKKHAVYFLDEIKGNYHFHTIELREAQELHTARVSFIPSVFSHLRYGYFIS